MLSVRPVFVPQAIWKALKQVLCAKLAVLTPSGLTRATARSF
jgi:hypothetical protein